MNEDRRRRQRKNRECARFLAEITQALNPPDFTVNAGLAGASGATGPEQQEEPQGAEL